MPVITFCCAPVNHKSKQNTGFVQKASIFDVAAWT